MSDLAQNNVVSKEVQVALENFKEYAEGSAVLLENLASKAQMVLEGTKSMQSFIDELDRRLLNNNYTHSLSFILGALTVIVQNEKLNKEEPK